MTGTLADALGDKRVAPRGVLMAASPSELPRLIAVDRESFPVGTRRHVLNTFCPRVHYTGCPCHVWNLFTLLSTRHIWPTQMIASAKRRALLTKSKSTLGSKWRSLGHFWRKLEHP